jgi:hypothetical protein
MELLKEKESLLQDQAWVESIVKKDHLNRFNLTNTDAPFNYFESFPDQILTRIQLENNNRTNKSGVKTFFINHYAKIAVAASFILLVAGAYLYNNTNIKKNTVVSIQEIPNEEMTNYVNTYEAIAELDFDLIIKKENASLENLEETEIQKIQKAITH